MAPKISRQDPSSAGGTSVQLASLGETVFCVPRNPKIDDYWNTLEDRLFKIRHSQNIDGVQRTLPLFEPPIDPALLVQAVAAGLDIGSVLNDVHASLPRYRFSFALQKALEFCTELKAFGSSLLSAHEKADAEGLARLRSTHEIGLLELAGLVKQRQLDEAMANERALRQSRASAETRYAHYQRLMANPEIRVPPEQAAMSLDSSRLRLSTDVGSDAAGFGLSIGEGHQLGSLQQSAIYSDIGSGFGVAASIAHVIPNFSGGTSVPAASVNSFGGSNIGNALSAVGQFFSLLASIASSNAGRSGIIAGHERRYDDWVLQSNLALREMEQIDKQLLAAEIRTDIATRELANHETQLDQSREADRFMREKFSNQELYQWMIGRLAEAYFAIYQLAYDLAKRSERAAVYELGGELEGIIRFGSWDSLRSGLLAGELLSLDLKRLEATYMDRNERQGELTLPVSLSELDPVALLTLQATGACEFTVPEDLYDSYLPGHYYRRIKTVSVSLPCVIGPHTSVSGTLTLVANSMRPKATSDDFVTDLAPIQSIVTSSATSDSGLFELNFRDERYLPFEGAGAASRWRFELPTDFRRFDYWTISDLILHVRYTARDGGAALKARAAATLRQHWSDLKTASDQQILARAYSLRRDFAAEWTRLSAATAAPATQTLTIDMNRFPFMLRSEQITVWKLSALVVNGVGATLDEQWGTLVAPDAAYPSTSGTPTATSTGGPRSLALKLVAKFDDAALYEFELGADSSHDTQAFDISTAASNSKWTISLNKAAASYRDVMLVVWWKLAQS